MARSLAEYELADTIYVSCEYVRDSFATAGVNEEKLRVMPLTPAPRFSQRERPPASEVFELLYVGSLSVVKGVPLLLEAFARLDAPDLRLVLQGGWESRGMRRHVQTACARDSRIELRGGDPLESLQSASLYVHPSYEDGFSYSTAEALACGVPVLLSENTGAKELVDPGRSGIVLRGGDLDALTEAIAAAHRGELLDG
jgi:glycosyltransferase involved in cell wall biosynthesis